MQVIETDLLGKSGLKAGAKTDDSKFDRWQLLSGSLTDCSISCVGLHGLGYEQGGGLPSWTVHICVSRGEVCHVEDIANVGDQELGC